MTIPADILAQLHRRIDAFAAVNPRMIEALAVFLETMWDHRPRPTAEQKPLERQ
jgi:acyl carrier protein phosphodiesterase